MVTFETYTGEKVNLNPEHVQTVTSHQSFDEDKPLPKEFYFLNASGLPEVRIDKKDEANALRTSERTLIGMTSGSSFEVKGTVDEVLKALKGK